MNEYKLEHQYPPRTINLIVSPEFGHMLTDANALIDAGKTQQMGMVYWYGVERQKLIAWLNEQSADLDLQPDDSFTLGVPSGGPMTITINRGGNE